MKTLLSFFLLFILCAACSRKPVQIGHINMISNRNISENGNYEMLQKFSNSSAKQLTRSRSKSINDAIDNVVKAVPGGEYLMNAKIYKVGRYYASEGDVWGVKEQKDINGLKPNATAYYKRRGGSETVTIISFIDQNRVNVKLENGKIISVDRERLVSKNDSE